MSALLSPKSVVQCPHCRQWHRVAVPYAETGVTRYTREMAFWRCRGQRYYAGQLGTAVPGDTGTPHRRPEWGGQAGFRIAVRE